MYVITSELIEELIAFRETLGGVVITKEELNEIIDGLPWVTDEEIIGQYGCPCCDDQHRDLDCRDCENGDYWVQSAQVVK